MNIGDLITNPDKVFWPDRGYTKLDLARYYDAVFAKLRPYVDDRLLSLDAARTECSALAFIRRPHRKDCPKALRRIASTIRIAMLHT